MSSLIKNLKTFNCLISRTNQSLLQLSWWTLQDLTSFDVQCDTIHWIWGLRRKWTMKKSQTNCFFSLSTWWERRAYLGKVATLTTRQTKTKTETHKYKDIALATCWGRQAYLPCWQQRHTKTKMKTKAHKGKDIALFTWWEMQAYLGTASMWKTQPPLAIQLILECKSCLCWKSNSFGISVKYLPHLCWGCFAYFLKVVNTSLEQRNDGAWVVQILTTLFWHIKALLAVQDSVNVQEYHLHFMASLKSVLLLCKTSFTIANVSLRVVQFLSAALIFSTSAVFP